MCRMSDTLEYFKGEKEIVENRASKLTQIIDVLEQALAGNINYDQAAAMLSQLGAGNLIN